MRGSIVLASVALLVACSGRPTDKGVSPAPPVGSTPEASPAAIREEALPVPEPSPWPIRPDERRDRATSPDVPIGRERPFQLYTHCGVDFRVDFDGSFWQSYVGGKTRAIGNPVQAGTMTLLSSDVAVFRFESQDDDASIYFVRNDTPKPEGGCF